MIEFYNNCDFQGNGDSLLLRIFLAIAPIVGSFLVALWLFHQQKRKERHHRIEMIKIDICWDCSRLISFLRLKAQAIAYANYYLSQARATKGRTDKFIAKRDEYNRRTNDITEDINLAKSDLTKNIS